MDSIEYKTFSKWVESAIEKGIPNEVISICFNLYDDIDDNWSIEMVGCTSYDSDDFDWACDEYTDFGTRNNPYSWNQKSDWEDIQQQVSYIIQKYLKEGMYKEQFINLRGVAVGFVDGDLIVLNY